MERNKVYEKYVERFQKTINDILNTFDKYREEEQSYKNVWNESMKGLLNLDKI